MKRDMDLIRGLLSEIESTPPGAIYEIDNTSLATEKSILFEHMLLLDEAGFVRSVEYENDGNAFCGGLTWQGHEFLNAARSDSVWREAKRLLRKNGLTVTGQILADLCASIAREKLGL